ncbi:DUF2946 family protein [Rhodobacteraceae bacterium NNCM2]|nr:DUF2946 family protein [Coraliihabitans acroporae]
MRKLRNNRCLLLLPALLWIFAQFQMATGVAAAPGADAFGGETIILCTPNGVIEVSAAEVYGDEEEPAGSTPVNTCGWCQSCASVDLPLRVGVPVRHALAQPADRAPLIAILQPGPRLDLGFQSRAPPV